MLSNVYARLGFDVLGDEAFKQLVLARLVEPTSKADPIRVLGGHEHTATDPLTDTARDIFTAAGVDWPTH